MNLNAGDNTIRFVSLTSSGAANLDRLDVFDCTLLGTESANQAFKFNLYPNPVTNLLTIEIAQEFVEGSTVQLYDITGKLVLKNKIEESVFTMNLKSLNAGVYLVKVANDNHSVVKRIIKK